MKGVRGSLSKGYSTLILDMIWFCLAVIVASVAGFFSEERPQLQEQLKKLSKRGSKGHMKYRFGTRLPQYTDFFCHETHGKEG